MISANRIEFRSYSSLDFDLQTCIAFESDDGETNSYLTREAVASESYRGEFKRIHNFKYTESYKPKFTFFKKNFEEFNEDEVRRTLSWLTGSPKASFLTVYKDDSNVISFEVLGGFSELSLYKIGNGRVVAIIAHFESATPYALSGLQTFPLNATESQNVADPSSNTFTITIDTDEPESPVYPRIVVQHDGSNCIRIADGEVLDVHSDMIANTVYYNGTTYYWKTLGDTNQESFFRPNYMDWTVVTLDAVPDEREIGVIYYYNDKYYWRDPYTFKTSDTNPQLTTTSVTIQNVWVDDQQQTHVETLRLANNTLDEKIVIDGANRVISSSRATRIFGDDFVNWNWLPLYNGENQITVIGNCKISFQYREVRKIGEY